MSLLSNPSLLWGTLLSLGYACLFHLWTGRSLRELVVFVVFAPAGFAVGHWIGQNMGLNLFQIGSTHVVEASLGAWLLLVAAKLLFR